MGIKLANNAAGTLAVAIIAADTTIVLTAGHGARFPSLAAGEYFYARLRKSSTGELEIIKVTARASDTLTVTRSQDGTSATTFSAGDEIRLTWPRAAAEDMRDEAANLGRVASSVDIVAANVALTSADKQKQKIITATADATLPPSADIAVGDWIDFKSSTEAYARILPDGSDTIDGDNAAYQLPSFMQVRAMKSASGAYVLLGRPDTFVGKITPTASNDLEKGHIWGNGQAYSATTYQGLFKKYVKTATVTISITSPSIVSWTGHPLRNGDPVKFTTTGALPTGVVQGIIYYAKNKTANTFEIAATPGGASINTSGTQSGVHTGIYAPHGCANDLSTFNTPDMKGRTFIGRDDMGDTAAASRITVGNAGFHGETLGAAGGDERMQNHNHALTDPGHVHGSHDHANNSKGNDSTDSGGSEFATNTGSATTGITIAPSGSGNSQNVQPSLVGGWMVKT